MGLVGGRIHQARGLGGVADAQFENPALAVRIGVHQRRVGLDRLDPAEFARFHALNQAYRDRFAFPFVICVRRQTKQSILAAFERRLLNDAATEIAAALAEILAIAEIRLAERIAL